MHALNLYRRAMLSTLLAVVAGCFSPARPRDIAIYASGSDLESGNPLVTVHPLSRQVQRYMLFTTLARYDSTLSPAPYAARRWEWSSDRRTLTLHLVQSLHWHDGVPTTARDVAFTLAAARDPATGYWRAADLAPLDSAVATDDSTAVLHFHSPQAEFPPVLCELPIVPLHKLAGVPRADMRRAAFDLAPIGNGPFRFVERRAGSRWTFRRNENFPREMGGPPSLAGVVITVVDEPTTKFAGLASGDLDVAGIAPTMASLAARDASMRVLSYPILFSTGIVFNVHKSPFDDARVRRAISFSIDRERIVQAALAGYGVAAAGPVPPESPLAAPGAPIFDTRRADSLFDAAGLRRDARGARTHNGVPFTFELLTVGSGDNALEQLVQADLAARGVRVEIRQSELGAFLTEARAPVKRFDALVAGVPGDISLSFLSSMFESAQRGSALDYSGYHDPRLDAEFRRARDAVSDSARMVAWRAVQGDLADAAPVAWIYHSRGLQGVSARLRNVTMDLRGEMVSVSRWRVDSATSRRVASR
jgi:peptide/nickel transport system substrate-binding protein